MEHSHERLVFGVFKAAEVNVHHGLLVGLKPADDRAQRNHGRLVQRYPYTPVEMPGNAILPQPFWRAASRLFQ